MMFGFGKNKSHEPSAAKNAPPGKEKRPGLFGRVVNDDALLCRAKAAFTVFARIPVVLPHQKNVQFRTAPLL